MAAASKVTLKLLIQTTDHKVLFAEAGKDFVDFLFYILSLPVGVIVKLLNMKNMVGSLGELCQSIEALSETYIQTKTKISFLNPKFKISSPGIPLLMLQSDNESEIQKFYTCAKSKTGSTTVASSPFSSSSIPAFSMSSSPAFSTSTSPAYDRHLYVSDVPNVPCPDCNVCMNTQINYVPPAAVDEGGFVKGVVSYMVMDNLEVTPMSTISCITLLNKFYVKDMGALEERTVDFGVDEGLKLLKASMECKTVLTSVFLGNMAI